MRNPLPQFLQPLFWEFDLQKLDLERNKWGIIERIINHGGLAEFKWLFSVYSVGEIREHLVENYNLSVQAVKLWAGVLQLNPQQCRCMQKPSLVHAFF